MTDFPDNPDVGDVFQNGRTFYEWDGEEWHLWHYGPTGPSGPVGPTGPRDVGYTAPNPVPIGGLIMVPPRYIIDDELPLYATTVPTHLPANFLFCDGTWYSWSSYPDLRDLLGNSYGGSPGVSWGVPSLNESLTAPYLLMGRASMTDTSPGSSSGSTSTNSHAHRTWMNANNVNSNSGGAHTHGSGAFNHDHGTGSNAANGNAGSLRRGNTNTTNFARNGHSHNIGYGATYTESNANSSGGHGHGTNFSITQGWMYASSSHDHAGDSVYDFGLVGVQFAIRAA